MKNDGERAQLVETRAQPEKFLPVTPVSVGDTGSFFVYLGCFVVASLRHYRRLWAAVAMVSGVIALALG